MTPTNKLQQLISENNIIPEKIYLYIRWKDLEIPDYYPEAIENKKQLDIVFNQYNIDYEDTIEVEDDSGWSGYFIYKFTEISEIPEQLEPVYLRLNYYHDSYDTDHELTDDYLFNKTIEFVEKTEQTAIKYEEIKKEKIISRLKWKFKEFLLDKNIVCIISNEELIREWEGKGHQIIEWPEWQSAGQNRRKEIGNYLVYIYEHIEEKYECVLFKTTKKLKDLMF